MAWTLGDDWSDVGGGDSELASVLSDIAIAINEREGIIGSLVPKFYQSPLGWPDGFTEFPTAGAAMLKPEPAEFDGLGIQDDDFFTAYLSAALGAMTSLVNGYWMVRWAKADENGDIVEPYEHIADVADLLGMGSYGSSWVSSGSTPGTFNLLNLFLQMKEAIENLRHPVYYPCIEFEDYGETPITNVHERASDRNHLSYLESEWEQAWDDTVAETPSNVVVGDTPSRSYQAYWTLRGLTKWEQSTFWTAIGELEIPTYSYDGHIVDAVAAYEYETAEFVGEFIACKYVVWKFQERLRADMDINVDGLTVTLDEDDDPWTIETIDRADWPTMNGSNQAIALPEFDESLPADSPFDLPDLGAEDEVVRCTAGLVPIFAWVIEADGSPEDFHQVMNVDENTLGYNGPEGATRVYAKLRVGTELSIA